MTQKFSMLHGKTNLMHCMLGKNHMFLNVREARKIPPLLGIPRKEHFFIKVMQQTGNGKV